MNLDPDPNTHQLVVIRDSFMEYEMLMDRYHFLNGLEGEFQTPQEASDALEASVPPKLEIADLSGGNQPQVEGESQIPRRLQQMRDVLEEAQASVPTKLNKIERMLNRSGPLSRVKRTYMAQMVGKMKDGIHKRFSIISKGISAILAAIKDGSLPSMTKGYKALQENFDKFLSELSQLSVLHNLASKCYSKGLITVAEKNAAFSTGMDATTLANNFLDLICSRVKDKKKYGMFLDILRSEPAYENLLILAGGSK